MLTLLHRSLQFSLVISEQGVNLAVSFIADRVNLRTKLLPRRSWILIEQGLKFIVMLLEQKPNLQLLLRSQFQISRKASKLLVDRLRRMNVLKLLTGGVLVETVVLSFDGIGHSEYENSRIDNAERQSSHGAGSLRILDSFRVETVI
jgi:hypothetical protein